jgi:palmitoyl-protein thioesterase
MLALFLLLSGAILTAGQAEDGPTPVVLWHGMGDSCCNPSSMGSIKVVNHSFLH